MSFFFLIQRCVREKTVLRQKQESGPVRTNSEVDLKIDRIHNQTRNKIDIF